MKLHFLHRFENDISTYELPEKFTFPFCYEPHPLSVAAAHQVEEYLNQQNDFLHNFGFDDSENAIGKMFGVMVVRDAEDRLGFIASVSGKLGNSNQHQYFVPPVFDLLIENDFFLEEEKNINAINRQIENLSSSQEFSMAKEALHQAKESANAILIALRRQHKGNKTERKEIRTIISDRPEAEQHLILEDLVKQSYRDQHLYAVEKASQESLVDAAACKVKSFENKISELRNERKLRSADLQRRIFENYDFMNAKGAVKNVWDIFREYNATIPPAGAGECAAPKLFQYAFKHGFQPICMAEFWYGQSPSSEIRKHLHFYPSCKTKCEPILNFMMDGLAVEINPLLETPIQRKKLTIVFEDEDMIVVDKPEELLSVPGKTNHESVYSIIRKQFPDLTDPIIVHRLDMSTSGIMVLAKNKQAHKSLQQQFEDHSIKKRYTALLDGYLVKDYGEIELPLRVDLDNRPQQLVCYDHGKPAKTIYKKVKSVGQTTKVYFYPITGRTHQLRVHAAHVDGLNMPIVGDDLYGTRKDRLHLHAGYLKLRHPRTGDLMEFESPDPF